MFAEGGVRGPRTFPKQVRLRRGDSQIISHVSDSDIFKHLEINDLIILFTLIDFMIRIL